MAYSGAKKRGIASTFRFSHLLPECKGRPRPSRPPGRANLTSNSRDQSCWSVERISTFAPLRQDDFGKLDTRRGLLIELVSSRYTPTDYGVFIFESTGFSSHFRADFRRPAMSPRDFQGHGRFELQARADKKCAVILRKKLS